MKYSRLAPFFLAPILFLVVFSLLAKLGYIPENLLAELIGSGPRASLSILPASMTIGVGEEIPVSVMLSSHTKVNVIDVLVQYPPAKLEPIRILKENSIANLWIGEPTLPNTSGKMQVTAGIISKDGFSGKGKLITIVFRAKSEGDGAITLSDASVLAHDGYGTNVLDESSGGEYKILATPVKRSPYDLNTDGVVDLKDVRVFIDGWGKSYDATLDFNGNHTVDFDDFLALVRAISPA